MVGEFDHAINWNSNPGFALLQSAVWQMVHDFRSEPRGHKKALLCEAGHTETDSSLHRDLDQQHLCIVRSFYSKPISIPHPHAIASAER